MNPLVGLCGVAEINLWAQSAMYSQNLEQILDDSFTKKPSPDALDLKIILIRACFDSISDSVLLTWNK